MPLREFLDWSGLSAGASEAAAKRAERLSDVSVGPLEWLRGGTREGAINAFKTRKQEELNEKYGEDLALAGKGGAGYGETKQKILGRIAQGQRQIKESDRNKEVQTALQLQAASQAPLLAQIRNQGKQLANQHTIALDTLQFQKDQVKQGNVDKQLDRAQDLRILQMQQEADQARYNQNLELYREDQKQGQINNLVAGLVALGAAFAV